ncbi:MAG: transposase, partial [Rhizobacter sp.]|nr:transposase [Bacteriovorax sp.]
GLKIIHFSLEHDHIHLYAECGCNVTLAKAMKAFGVSLVKAINKLSRAKGTLYKYRYHLRVLKSASEVKNVINYVLKNGIKHGRTLKVINPYNSALALHDFGILKIHLKKADIRKMAVAYLEREGAWAQRMELLGRLDEIYVFRKELSFI